MVKVRMTPEAAQQLDGLNNPIHGRMLRLIDRLQNWPDVSGAKPLRHGLKGRYRLRTGDYRLQFRVAATSSAGSGDTVTIEKIGHRDNFYQD